MSYRCAIMHGGILAASINYTVKPLRYMVPVEAFVFSVASRAENLYNLVLCITRAINVILPVYRVGIYLLHSSKIRI